MDETKLKILRACGSVIARVGAKGLTLDAVAREAKLSKGGLLYHYESKSKLVMALVELAINEFEHALQTKKGDWLENYVAASMGSSEFDAWTPALLSAVIEDETLLLPLRKAMNTWYEKARQSYGSRGVSVLLMLDGLYTHKVFGLGDLVRPSEIASLLDPRGDNDAETP